MHTLTAILTLFIVSTSFALTKRQAQTLAEKSYSRDNTFCRFKDKTIEIEIRGEGRYTEKQDTLYGQYVFQVEDNKFSLLPINKQGLGRYKFYRGDNKMCSKSIGIQLDPSTAAILFLKENRPFKEKLVIQLYDTKSATPKDAIETDYLTDKIELTQNGFHFRTVMERVDRQIGKINIGDHQYIYQDQEMTPWMSYTAKGFETLGTKTYENSEFKLFFRDETDFLMFSGWNSQEKKFSNLYVYTAVNHELKKECILFTNAPQKNLTGSEFWRCKDK